MDRKTPAIEIRPKDLEKNAEALRRCLTMIPSGEVIKRVVDIRFGLGGWAWVVADLFPKATILGFEADFETYKKAKAPNRTTLHFLDFQKTTPASIKGLKQPDLLLADYNNATILKPDSLEETLEQLQPRFVVFTDVASSKLHLNYAAYGLEKPSLDDYWKRYRVKGYSLLGFAQTHHHASTAIYRRNKKPPVV